ncbi:hypothetical protein OROMI_014453 [Orobanche minor]
MYYISLSSTSSSLVLLHFKNKRSEELQKRQTLHTKEIRALLSKDTLPDRPNTGLNINAQQTVPIHDILATTEPGRFTSTVKGQLLRTNQKFVYLCCDRCHCLTSAKYVCLFECRSCRLNKIATPRYRFSLSVFDATGELEVTMFGKEAEKLLNLSADDFWQKYQEDNSFVHTFINSKLEEMLLQIEIQSKTFLKQDGNTILSYTVQSLNCQKTTPLPACPGAFTEQPSSCGITYLVPAENSNHNENLTTSTQAPPEVRLPLTADKVALVPWWDMVNHACEVDTFVDYDESS